MPVGPDNRQSVLRRSSDAVPDEPGDREQGDNTMLGGASMDYGIVLPNGWGEPRSGNAAKSHQACARRRLTIA